MIEQNVLDVFRDHLKSFLSKCTTLRTAKIDHRKLKDELEILYNEFRKVRYWLLDENKKALADDFKDNFEKVEKFLRERLANLSDLSSAASYLSYLMNLTGPPREYDDILFTVDELTESFAAQSKLYAQSGQQQDTDGAGGGGEKQVYTEIDVAGRKQGLEVTIPELIAQGESHTLEFKETFEYDTRQRQKNDAVLKSTLKTIAAFLNADGGTLLIGVSDSGQIEGIQRDFSLLPTAQRNNDKFELRIRNHLQDRFQPVPIGRVNMSFKELDERTVCKVDVQESREIIHLDAEVYVRDGNKTQILEGRNLTDWIRQRSRPEKDR